MLVGMGSSVPPALTRTVPLLSTGPGRDWGPASSQCQVPSRMSYPLLVPVGVKMTVMMIVAVVEIIIVMVEALVATAGLFSVTGVGSVKEASLSPWRNCQEVPKSMRAD